jgi:hypothetical protein
MRYSRFSHLGAVKKLGEMDTLLITRIRDSNIQPHQSVGTCYDNQVTVLEGHKHTIYGHAPRRLNQRRTDTPKSQHIIRTNQIVY